MNNSLRRTALSLAALAAGLSLSPSAFAQALTAPNVGTSASGPTTLDPAAVYWNPGMLGMFEKPTMLGGLNVVWGDIRYKRERRGTYQYEDSLKFAEPVPPSAIDRSKTGQATEVKANPFAPAAAGFGAIPIGKTGLVAGLGAYAPYAALIKFDQADGPQRWALQEATIAALYVTPAIAYRLHETFSLGLGASYVMGFAELKKVQDFAALGDVGQGLARPPIDQRNDFRADAPTSVRELSVMSRPIVLRRAIAHGFTFNVGAAYQPIKALRFGLTYLHSTKLNFNGKVTIDMDDDFFTQDLASQGLAYKKRIEGDATLTFTLPRSLVFGTSYDINDKWGVGLMVQGTTWSQVQSFDVVAKSPDLAQPKLGLPDTSQISLSRRWRDTIAIELTGRFKPTDSLGFWLMGGYRSPASPDQTVDVASPDGQRIVAALGASFKLSESLSLLADFKGQTILPRKVEASDYDLGNGEYRLTLLAFGGYLQLTL